MVFRDATTSRRDDNNRTSQGCMKACLLGGGSFGWFFCCERQHDLAVTWKAGLCGVFIGVKPEAKHLTLISIYILYV